MLSPIHERLEFLGITKKLGCGTEGCVYATDHGTVVKVNALPPAQQEGSGRFDAVRLVRLLQQLAARHPSVPRIFTTGLLPAELLGAGFPTQWVEREPLNDLQLSLEAEGQFLHGELGKLLANAYDAKKSFTLPRSLPFEERKVLMQVGLGYNWLQARGLDPQDHNTPENWGQRADGTVALRDFGYIQLNDVLIAKWSKS